MSAQEGEGAEAIDTGQVDADEFARNIGSAGDEDLAASMSGPLRDQILDEIFSRMASHFRASKASDTESVIHWRIGGRADGGHDEFETVIAGGACDAHRGFARDDAKVTFTIGGPDFLRLVSGNAAGPTLFMSGKLKIEGDLIFAASAASLFEIPKA
jgi:putative sterol carrier protein